MIASPISVADVLERAAARLAGEGAWTQRAFARRHDGSVAYSSCDPRVCSWCLGGALLKENEATPFDISQVANAVRAVIGADLVGWNDAPERTQEQVVAVLREAATKARSPHVGEDAG